MLLALTAAASFIMAFTDSYTDPDTRTTFYGVVTPKGLCSPTISHVVNAQDDPEATGARNDPEATSQPLLGDTLRGRLADARSSQLYKPKFGDFAHALVTVRARAVRLPCCCMCCATTRDMCHCHAVTYLLARTVCLGHILCACTYTFVPTLATQTSVNVMQFFRSV